MVTTDGRSFYVVPGELSNWMIWIRLAIWISLCTVITWPVADAVPGSASVGFARAGLAAPIQRHPLQSILRRDTFLRNWKIRPKWISSPTGAGNKYTSFLSILRTPRLVLVESHVITPPVTFAPAHGLTSGKVFPSIFHTVRRFHTRKLTIWWLFLREVTFSNS